MYIGPASLSVIQMDTKQDLKQILWMYVLKIDAGRLFLALTLSKYIKTRTAISIASKPSLRRMKNELKKGVKEVSIIKNVYNKSNYYCQ